VWRRRRPPWRLHTRDGRLVAELHDPSPDWPWTYARAEPGPAWDEAQARLDDDGVLGLPTTLTDPRGVETTDHLLHLDGDVAWWR
jgi:hypothetical protein